MAIGRRRRRYFNAIVGIELFGGTVTGTRNKLEMSQHTGMEHGVLYACASRDPLLHQE